MDGLLEETRNLLYRHNIKTEEKSEGEITFIKKNCFKGKIFETNTHNVYSMIIAKRTEMGGYKNCSMITIEYNIDSYIARKRVKGHLGYDYDRMTFYSVDELLDNVFSPYINMEPVIKTKSRPNDKNFIFQNMLAQALKPDFSVNSYAKNEMDKCNLYAFYLSVEISCNTIMVWSSLINNGFTVHYDIHTIDVAKTINVLKEIKDMINDAYQDIQSSFRSYRSKLESK